MLPSSLPEPAQFSRDTGEPSLRWGVVGVGWIAGFFAAAVSAHTSQQIVAVASRSAERAGEFAARHGIEHAHADVDALLSDPSVDVVYVAAPQSEHLDIGLRAIAAGKHVLIEKPIAIDAAGAQRLVDAAASAGVFLMEAMWSRYQPQADLVRRIIAEGIIGEPRLVIADHGQAIADDPDHRLLLPGTGGGALLDLGIYPIQLDSMVLGRPDAVRAVGSLTPSGVDATSTLVLDHGDEQSTLMTSLLTRTPTIAAVCGTLGRIDLEGPFHIPTAVTVRSHDLFEPALVWRDDTGVALMDGLAWQATALAGYVGEGRLESPLHPLDETVSIIATIDEARRQLGAR
ncbi:Gfo/Idh/MocA family oxidoreductase [Microbacterium aoyamense]|uniref:Gfo/Idh/MocA family oxidoreductase n=1 Tax=Microbacterium aoyamense TaxID=344166 RepID=A0ABN2PL10_9MICO|nr:Gfo/Idh/MocA family oxidoreductase [Microbacterium aoyamense]